jgi:hypothetical protein
VDAVPPAEFLLKCVDRGRCDVELSAHG